MDYLHIIFRINPVNRPPKTCIIIPCEILISRCIYRLLSKTTFLSDYAIIKKKHSKFPFRRLDRFDLTFVKPRCTFKYIMWYAFPYGFIELICIMLWKNNLFIVLLLGNWKIKSFLNCEVKILSLHIIYAQVSFILQKNTQL